MNTLRVFIPELIQQAIDKARDEARPRRDRYRLSARHTPLLRLLRRRALGLTDEEAAALLGMKQRTVRAYRMELVACGLVEAVGTRQVDAHHHAHVHRLTAAGIKAVHDLGKKP